MKIVRCGQCGWWWQVTIGPLQRRRWLVWPLRRRRAVLFRGPFWPGRADEPRQLLTYVQLAEEYGDCVRHLAEEPGVPYWVRG